MYLRGNMEFIPAFFYPTTLVCVDDVAIALDGYKQLFANSNYKCLFYNDAESVISFFNNYSPPLRQINFISKVSTLDSDKASTKTILQLDISENINLAKSETKYSEVSVLLSDYNMQPGIDGIHLCKVLKDQRMQKMLLTEDQTYKAAREALNSNTIDYFASKTDSPELVKEAVEMLSLNFFCNITSHFKKHLEANSTSPLSDPIFIKYFFDLVKHNNIVEYYLIDKNGSYLLIDSNKQKYVLIVHNDYSLTKFTDVLIEYVNLTEQLKLINEKILIPFLGIQKEISTENLLNLGNYLYPATTLSGTHNYYVHLLVYNDNI